MFGYIIYLVEQTWNGLSAPYCSLLGKQACRYSEGAYNAAMPRELVRIDQPGFRGWGCSQCAWISQTRFRAELILVQFFTVRIQGQDNIFAHHPFAWTLSSIGKLCRLR